MYLISALAITVLLNLYLEPLTIAPVLIFGPLVGRALLSGCVVAELMLGQPIFPGENGVDQLVEIIKILGTPTKEQIQAMNPNYTEFRFPIIKPCPWNKVGGLSCSFLLWLGFRERGN